MLARLRLRSLKLWVFFGPLGVIDISLGLSVDILSLAGFFEAKTPTVEMPCKANQKYIDLIALYLDFLTTSHLNQ